MDQYRVSPVGRRAKDVGPKGDAVSHGDGNTGVDPEWGLGAKRQRAEACGGEENEEDGMPEHESNATRFHGKPLRAVTRELGMVVGAGGGSCRPFRSTLPDGQGRA